MKVDTPTPKVRFTEPSLQIDDLPLSEFVKVLDYVQSLVDLKIFKSSQPHEDYNPTSQNVDMVTDFTA